MAGVERKVSCAKCGRTYDPSLEIHLCAGPPIRLPHQAEEIERDLRLHGEARVQYA